MSICFFTVPAAANNAAHVTRVIPRQKSTIYAHLPATRHDVAMKRRSLVHDIKEEKEDARR